MGSTSHFCVDYSKPVGYFPMPMPMLRTIVPSHHRVSCAPLYQPREVEGVTTPQGISTPPITSVPRSLAQAVWLRCLDYSGTASVQLPLVCWQVHRAAVGLLSIRVARPGASRYPPGATRRKAWGREPYEAGEEVTYHRAPLRSSRYRYFHQIMEERDEGEGLVGRAVPRVREVGEQVHLRINLLARSRHRLLVAREHIRARCCHCSPLLPVGGTNGNIYGRY